MFIEIDASILSSPDLLSKYRYKVMELLLTHYRGEHFMFFSSKKEYIENLRGLFSKEEFYSKLLNKIVNDLSEIAGLRKDMETKCVIVEHILSHHNSSKIIYIPISKLKVPIVETKLLGENLTDANFYQELTKLFIKRKNSIYKGNIKCEPVGGGGATTSKVLAGIVSQRKYFCLCITDSDFDGQKVTSDTPKNVEKFCFDNQGSFSHYKLSCRELENLIPPEYYRRILSGDSITQIDKLISSGFDEQKFYDYKKHFGVNIFETYYKEDFTRNRNNFYKDLPSDYTSGHEELIRNIVEWCCAPNPDRYLI